MKPSPIIFNGYHTVGGVSKGEIFASLFKREEELALKNESTVLLADSAKGILHVRRMAYFEFSADTTINNELVRNVVVRKVPFQYLVEFNIGSNRFIYKVFGFSTLNGKAILRNDRKNPALSNHAEKEVWNFRDGLTSAAISMSMDRFK